jgi:hypothetical protein
VTSGWIVGWLKLVSQARLRTQSALSRFYGKIGACVPLTCMIGV